MPHRRTNASWSGTMSQGADRTAPQLQCPRRRRLDTPTAAAGAHAAYTRSAFISMHAWDMCLKCLAWHTRRDGAPVERPRGGRSRFDEAPVEDANGDAHAGDAPEDKGGSQRGVPGEALPGPPPGPPGPPPRREGALLHKLYLKPAFPLRYV